MKLYLGNLRITQVNSNTERVVFTNSGRPRYSSGQSYYIQFLGGWKTNNNGYINYFGTGPKMWPKILQDQFQLEGLSWTASNDFGFSIQAFRLAFALLVESSHRPRWQWVIARLLERGQYVWVLPTRRTILITNFAVQAHRFLTSSLSPRVSDWFWCYFG